MSNNWEVITAISTATTAIVAIFTYGLVRWQWQLNKPTISYSTPCDTRNTYGTFSFSIEGADKEKWFIKNVKLTKPRGANIAVKVSGPENKPIPGNWVKDIAFGPQTLNGGIFFTAPSGAEVIFKVYTSLKVKPSKTLGHKVSVVMHKYEKP